VLSLPRPRQSTRSLETSSAAPPVSRLPSSLPASRHRTSLATFPVCHSQAPILQLGSESSSHRNPLAGISHPDKLVSFQIAADSCVVSQGLG
jgi:hypothetical protein